MLIECNNMLGQKEGSWFPFRKDVINISFYRVMHRDPDALPELLTTIFSQEDNQEKITVGNILGSNIYNLLFIGGVINLFSPATHIQPANLIILALITILFFLIIKHYGGQKIPRWISIILFLFLGSYLYYLGISK